MVKLNLSSKKKIRNLLFFGIAIFLFLICRLGIIQFVQGKELSKKAYEQQTLDRAISAKRGYIYDSSGEILAKSSTIETVTVNPVNIKKEDKERVAKILSEIFEIDYENVLKKVNKRSSIEIIAKKVDKQKTDTLRNWMKDNNFLVRNKYR